MNKHRYYFDRISMAFDDLLRCRRYCELMLKLPLGESLSEERTVHESLFVAFVVSYGRVFTKSKTVDKQLNEAVSNDFGSLVNRIRGELEHKHRELDKRIHDKRDTAIAHSDGRSRNYQHYGDTLLGTGRNPYYPYDYDEVKEAIDLVSKLISQIGIEQSRIGKLAFTKSPFEDSAAAP